MSKYMGPEKNYEWIANGMHYLHVILLLLQVEKSRDLPNADEFIQRITEARREKYVN